MFAKLNAKLDDLLGPIISWTTPILMVVITFVIWMCNPVNFDSDPDKTFQEVAAQLKAGRAATAISSEDSPRAHESAESE